MFNIESVTDGTRTPTLPDDIWDEVYPLLRDNVGVGKPIMVKEVASRLGVSSPSVSAWIRDKNRPNSYNLIQVLRIIAERCPETRAQDVSQRLMRKFQGGPEQPSGTLAAAEAAARRLTELDGIPPDEAWLLMRGMTGSESDMYFAARAVLSSNALVERHRSRADEMVSAAAAIPRVKAR